MLSKLLNSRTLINRAVARSFGAELDKATYVDKREDSGLTEIEASIAYGRAKLESVKETLSYMEYKKIPTHIPHWNPESPEYLPSEIDDYEMKVSTDAYNKVVDDLKLRIKIQEELYDAIERMDRPYLRGQPGIDKNVFEKVANYQTSAGNTPMTEFEITDQVYDDNYGNRHRFIANAVYENSARFNGYSHMVAWQNEKDNRPINHHFNRDKGYKFDVMVPYDERAPHVADRLGHPYLLGDSLDRFLRVEQYSYHPNFIDQPFVQTPPVDADADVNFEEGDVVYENPNVLEWAKFYGVALDGLVAFAAAYYPYHLLLKNTTFMQDWSKGLQSQFGEFNILNFDNWGMAGLYPILGLYYHRVSHELLTNITSDFVVRAQYNKDEDILFLTIPGSRGAEQEVVVEMDHLEILPPAGIIGLSLLSANDTDGYYTLTDMNKNKSYRLRVSDK